MDSSPRDGRVREPVKEPVKGPGFVPASRLRPEAGPEEDQTGTSKDHDPAGPREDPEPGPVVLPYPERPGQQELAREVHEACSRGTHAVLEAGTGTGKTVAVLAAALSASRETGRRILWLTRTNAQARQVLVELRAIQGHPGAMEAAGGPLLAVCLQGRHHMCPQLAGDPRYEGADSEEYARLCSSLKRATPKDDAHPAWLESAQDLEHDGEAHGAVRTVQREATAPKPESRSGGSSPVGKPLPVASSKGCPWYARLLASDPHEWAARLLERPLGAEELAEVFIEKGICPYEAAKGLLPDARLVVAPYVYLTDRRLSKAFTQWTDSTLSQWIVVFDEAHNLPDHLRDLYSGELGRTGLERALDEALKAGDPMLGPGVSASRLVKTVQAAVEQVGLARLDPEQEDARVSRDDLVVPVLSGLKIASTSFSSIVSALHLEGQRIREEALRRGKLPRSYLGSLAGFLRLWMEASPGEYVPLVERGGSLRLVMYCLDPSLGARVLQEVHASVHISGTLRPLAAHRDLLGLPVDTRCRSFPSPYPKENLRLVLVDDVTTRFEDRQRDPAMMDRLADHVASFARVRGINAMVLFPSYGMLEETRGLALGDIRRRVFLEEPGLAQRGLHERLQRFREEGLRLDEKQQAAGGALWLGVAGGRVSEGMDFPGRTLEALCLVGVPYPRPSARHEALMMFNEIRFRRGWEYTVEAPTWRKIQQAVGRVVRDADDRGVVFLLDSRFRRWAHEFGRLERLGDEERIDKVLGDWVDHCRENLRLVRS